MPFETKNPWDIYPLSLKSLTTFVLLVLFMWNDWTRKKKSCWLPFLWDDKDSSRHCLNTVSKSHQDVGLSQKTEVSCEKMFFFFTRKKLQEQWTWYLCWNSFYWPVLFCNLSVQFAKSEGVLFDSPPIVTNQENYLLRTITHDNYPWRQLPLLLGQIPPRPITSIG